MPRRLEVDGFDGPEEQLAAQREIERSKLPALQLDHNTWQEAARLACEQMGISWPGTILPEGTALYQSGLNTLKADRARWARLPTASEAIPVVMRKLEAEDRVDAEDVPINTIRLQPETARLYRTTWRKEGQEQREPLGYSEHAFRQLTQQIPSLSSGTAPRGTSSVLLYLSNSERAAIVNNRIDKAGSNVLIRTKLADNGKRIIRAILSERYGDVKDTDVAEAIRLGLNGEGKIAKLDYLPGESRSQFELIWPSEIPVETFRVGDVHRASVSITNSETGQGALKITPRVIRAACANLTLSYGVGIEVSLRHIGSAARIKGQMQAAINQAAAQVGPLVSAITLSAKTAIPDNMTPSQIFARIGKAFEMGKERVNDWQTTYEKGYSQSPTLWGVTSAITEAAQHTDWWGAEQEEVAIASQLVSVHWGPVL